MRHTRIIWILTVFTITLFVAGNTHAQAEKLWQEQLWCDCDPGYGFGCSLPILAVADSGFVYVAYMWQDDVALYKFDQYGNFLWDRLYGSGGTSATRPFAITVDQAGAVYVSGSFDPDWALGEPKDQEFVTVKYTPDGTLAWEGRYTIAGPLSIMQLRDSEISSDGYLYTYGNTGFIYDPYPPDPDNILYDHRTVLLKYDATSGNLEWARDSNYGKHFVQTSIWWNTGLVLGPHGDVFTGGSAIIDEGWCVDATGTDSTHWEQTALFFTHYGSDGALLGTEEYTDDNFDPCNPEPNSWHAVTVNVAGDDQGNLYAVGLIPDPTERYHHLFKFNSSLSLQWISGMESDNSSFQTDLMVDLAGDIIFTSYRGTFKFNEAGAQIWSGQGGSILGYDGENNLYVGGVRNEIVDFYDPMEVDPYPEWSTGTLGGAIFDMHVDAQGQIFTANWGGTGCPTVRVGMLAQEHYIRFWDGQDSILGNTELELYKVHNDPPYFTEDHLGNFETDSLGFFKFPLIPDDKMVFPISMDNLDPDTLSRDDTLKVSRYISDSTTVKHPLLFDNMYSISQDNLNFDTLGVPSYPTLSTGVQNWGLNHAEIRYNLVVSVEWDASKQYLQSLEASFRSAANYLYDVTDGQVRFDTVYIFDDTAHWDEADIYIYADNMYHPNAYVDHINFATDLGAYFPRRWSSDPRNDAYHDHPLDLDVAIMYRTYIHELGHYALGFYDEYMLWDPSDDTYKNDPTLRCGGIPNYGLMQSQYPAPDPYSTEMSNAFHYESDQCKNTQQFGYRGVSCWDYFEAKFEGDYINDANDTFFVEIFQPNDPYRNSVTWPTGYVYLEGPNNFMHSHGVLDYDVGDKVVLPNGPADPKAGVREVDVEVRVGGLTKPNVEVWLNEYLSPGEWRLFKQGNTADNGRIWILGAENGDVVQSAGFSANIGPTALASQVDEPWFSGAIAIDADSMTLDLTPVDGYFPMICEASLEASSFDCRLMAETMFSTAPSLSYRPSTGGAFDYAFGATADGYDATLAEASGSGGNMTVTAEDNSAAAFFFSNTYTHTQRTPSATSLELFGPGGEIQIEFDSLNTSLEQAMFLSSPYTIIRTGLTDANIQASKTHSLSVYPSGAMTGTSLMRIHYSESDIVSRGASADNEASLKIFRWAGVATGWHEVGGTVDTVFNQVVETISEPGVYAAFTTDVSVGVEDDEHGGVLPYRFELSQNYPNPFNPATTIEYSIPERSHVKIEVYNVLGQKVRSLVDREEGAGSYAVTWDGLTASGKPAATGVYLYRFQTRDHSETKKMLLLK